MALTKASFSMINGAPVNVLDFGADPTGAVDSTAAFQAAVATQRIINVPFGTYRVDNPITLDNAPASVLTLIGQAGSHNNVAGIGKVVIDLTNNTSHFISMGYAPRIDNIQFKNGVDVFHYTTQNSDCSICELNHVRAFEFSGVFFKCYAFGNGTHVTWNNPVIVSNKSTSVVWDDATNFPAQGLDNLTINDGWIETASTVGFKICVGRFTLYATRFIPYPSANSVWLDHYGSGIVEAFGIDFGGESGRRIINWRARGGEIYFTDCGLFGFPAATAIMLYAAPKAMSFTSIIADSNPATIVGIDPSMTAADINYLLTTTNLQFDNQSKNLLNNLVSTTNAASTALAGVNSPNTINTSVKSSDCISGLGFTWISSSSSTNVTVVTGASATDIYGANTQGIKYTASATDPGFGSALMNASPGLSSLVEGWYTLEAVVTVDVDGVRFTLAFSEEVSGGAEATKVFWLSKGTHRVCFPCYYSTGVVKNAGYLFSIPKNGALSITRIKVFAGAYNSRDFDLRGTAAPTGSTVYWERGDRIINSVPAAGQPKAWVCTVGGAPGTWVSEGNL